MNRKWICLSALLLFIMCISLLPEKQTNLQQSGRTQKTTNNMFFSASEKIKKQLPGDKQIVTQKNNDKKEQATLPKSLKIIGTEAFEGTALANVEIPQSVNTIDERAFANSPNLTNIHIPKETRIIGEKVFENSPQLYLISTTGSYAKAWAHKYDIQIEIEIGLDVSEKQIIVLFNPERHSSIQKYNRKAGKELYDLKARRKGRTDAETKTVQKRGIASVYVQSRYFP